MLCILNNSGNSNRNCNCDSCFEKRAIESLIKDAALWKKKRDRAIRSTRLTQFTLNKSFLKNLLTRNENFNDRLKKSKARADNVSNENQPSTSKDYDEKSIRLKSHKKRKRSRSSSSDDSSSEDPSSSSSSSSSDSSIELIIAKKRKRKKHRKSKYSRKRISPSTSPTYEDIKSSIHKSIYSKYLKIHKEANKKYMKQLTEKVDSETNLEENNGNQNTAADSNSTDVIEITAEETAPQSNVSPNELLVKKGTAIETEEEKSLKVLEVREDIEPKRIENKEGKSEMANKGKMMIATKPASSLYSDDEDAVFLKIVPFPEKSPPDATKVDPNPTEKIEATATDNEGKDMKAPEKPKETVRDKNESRATTSKDDSNTEALSEETSLSRVSFSFNSKVNKTVVKPTEFQHELENSDESERKKPSSRLKKRYKKSKKSKKSKKRHRTPALKSEKSKSERRGKSRSEKRESSRSKRSERSRSKTSERSRSKRSGRSRSRDRSYGRRRSSTYETTKSRPKSFTKSPSRYSKASYTSASSKSRYRSYSRSGSKRSYSRSSRRSRSDSRRKYSSSRYSYSSGDRHSYRNSRSSSRHRSRSRSSTESRGRSRSISFSYVYTNPEKARKYYKRSSSTSSDSDHSRKRYKDK